MTILLTICLLIWLPIFFYQIHERGFLILIGWLLIAPVATNLMSNPGANPFFPKPSTTQQEITSRIRKVERFSYLELPTRITADRLFEPTRTLFGVFVLVFLLDILMRKRGWVPLDRTEIW